MLKKGASDDLRSYFIANTPTKSLIPPADIAEAALMLAVNNNMNGTVLTIDGGFTAG